MPSLIESVKIPKERIAVLIGKNGSIKKEIEKLTGVELEIDSSLGEVFLEPKEGEGTANFLSAVSVVKAIGRGFSPQNAFLLLDEENFLSIIDISNFGKAKKGLISRKGRVIGSGGRARQRIEEETQTKISVFGKTISIIGKAEHVDTAKKAVEMLLNGAKHATIFKFLHESSLETGKFEL